MSDTPDQNDPNPETRNSSDGAADQPGLSRRDFLRRASKEAAATGTRLVPGAAIARTVLGVGTPEPADTSGDTPDEAKTKVPRWLRALVSRRSAGTSGNHTTSEGGR